ncbi:hypothetical protein AADZ90_010365 [Aestuariibius sp. 2305UL40-4]|uniref:hypothetical protein n=1 Tax=Aestuariibius violaceus TaxID=3234132 RepID=UPI00345E3377
MTIRILVLILALAAPFKLAAQEAEAPLFTDYDALRTALDGHMTSLNLQAAYAEILPNNAVNEAQLAQAEQLFRQALPEGLTGSSVLRREEFEGGFTRELIGYYSGARYLFVFLQYHAREDGVAVFTLNVSEQLQRAMEGF